MSSKTDAKASLLATLEREFLKQGWDDLEPAIQEELIKFIKANWDKLAPLV